MLTYIQNVVARTISPEKVIFNGPATIAIYPDGKKVVVKCREGDPFDKEKGLMMNVLKKSMHFRTYNEILSSFKKPGTAINEFYAVRAVLIFMMGEKNLSSIINKWISQDHKSLYKNALNKSYGVKESK